MTDVLYSCEQIAKSIGMSKSFVRQHRKQRQELNEQFYTTHQGGNKTPLWTQQGKDSWADYMEERNGQRPGSFDPLSAINVVNHEPVTWKLWWQALPSGGTRWWFSTPRGWYYSEDDNGRHWRDCNRMRLNSDFCYHMVDPATIDRGSIVAAVLRHAGVLRRAIESDIEVEERVEIRPRIEVTS